MTLNYTQCTRLTTAEQWRVCMSFAADATQLTHCSSPTLVPTFIAHTQKHFTTALAQCYKYWTSDTSESTVHNTDTPHRVSAEMQQQQQV